MCDLIITPDTLTMHLALALKKPTIALFTSTSPTEIYDYGRLKKVVAECTCSCCYEKRCNKHAICCSNSITVDEIMNKINEIETEEL
jgi:ADP-heptose:LPS heptosyltransferase